MTAANTAMFSTAATICPAAVSSCRPRYQTSQTEVADDGPGDQGHVRRLAGSAGLRQERGEVSGPGERVRVAAVRVDDREEARDQTEQAR